MAVRPIVKYPDSRLRQPTVRVEQVTDATRKLVADMTDSMYATAGAGIAANQIGAPERIFVIDPVVAGGKEDDPARVFVNPEMVWLGPETETRDEGCLSFPEVFVPIKRSLRARVRGTDLDGNPVEAEGEGLCARAFQHELDHLNGKLLIDHVGPLKKEMIKRKLRRAAERERRGEAVEADDTSG